ncbi:MAG TPA: hypothetical protein PKE16_17960 [Hyphomicrobium sp.]|nr:hypothetical protein [Hyphomicrobium sp.]
MGFTQNEGDAFTAALKGFATSLDFGAADLGVDADAENRDRLRERILEVWRPYIDRPVTSALLAEMAVKADEARKELGL